LDSRPKTEQGVADHHLGGNWHGALRPAADRDFGLAEIIVAARLIQHASTAPLLLTGEFELGLMVEVMVEEMQ
jgi:hypothetical protein